MASGTSLTLRKLIREDGALWDGLIESSPQGSVFLRDGCLSGWAESEPGLHSLRFGCFDDAGRLVAGQVFLYRRKVFGIRVQTCLNFPYNSSPILAGFIQPGSPAYGATLQQLARKANRLFPAFTFECHPSLQDVRPFLEIGWRVVPEYTHTCDLRDPAALLERLGSRSKFRRASKGLDRYVFADETADGLEAQFPALYRKSAARYGLALDEDWEATFSARIDWLLRNQAARCFSCRKKDGTLLGIMICVLNQAQQSAHGWMMAYDLSLGEKDFLRALHLYTLHELAGTALHLDIADGIRPPVYEFKDSLGTDSTPYFLVESPRTDLWSKAFEVYRGARGFLAKAGA